MKIRINTHDFSRIFWRDLFSTIATDPVQINNNLQEISKEQSALIATAQVQTGSVGDSTMWCLYALARAFNPQCVAEVGTYIGNSTLAIAQAMDLSGPGPKRIHTCDASNEISILPNGTTEIFQYKMTSSTNMFSDLLARKEIVDMYFIDGRLAANDSSLMTRIARRETIYVLDDFEGIEKGVVNALGLSEFILATHILVYPPDRELLSSYGLKDRGLVAAWVPRSIFILSRQ